MVKNHADKSEKLIFVKKQAMTKQKIRWIIFLMAVALLGLVGFQAYWLNEALTTKKERFRQQVQEALQATVLKLEQQEVLQVANRQMQAPPQNIPDLVIDTIIEIQPQKKLPEVPKVVATAEKPTQKRIFYLAENSLHQEVPDSLLLQWIDSLKVIKQYLCYDENLEEKNLHFKYNYQTEKFRKIQTEMLQKKSLKFQQHQKLKADSLLALFHKKQVWTYATNTRMQNRRKDLQKIQSRLDSLQQKISRQVRSRTQVATAHLSLFSKVDSQKIHMKTPENQTITIRQRFQQARHKSEIVKGVFDELVAKPRPIADRLNKRLLDSLLRYELNNHGIVQNYQYAIQIPDQPHFIFTSNKKEADFSGENTFTATLFPTDVFNKNALLKLYFPEQQKFIFQEMGIVLLSSGSLILVVLICFCIAITTILRQKKLSDMKTDFINNMTHELKTPLATIALAAEFLQDTSVNVSNQTRYLQVIQEEAKRLSRHVEEVLQTARLEKGEIILNLEKYNIHELIRQITEHIGVQIEKRQGSITLDLQAQHAVIEADTQHLTNVIENLLDNANKYSPEKPEISIKTENSRNGLLFTITDQGIGMSKEAQQRIFDTFYRIPSGNVHNAKGFGLGLSYAKNIVELHGGSISVESQPEKGTIFKIFLPQKEFEV
ncbi:MAG: hypothetical protein H7Y04_03985 [Verrucomicrobia bacterium]|nr:hypothetical protein [Cytophagales bacterium]